jgi:peptide deformylase
MIRPIVRHGAAVLHRPATPVTDITPDIHQLIDDMVQTMYAAPGVGLAATQVGVPLRIFVADVSFGRNP